MPRLTRPQACGCLARRRFFLETITMRDTGKRRGQVERVHAVTCPSENALHVVEILNRRVQALLLTPRRATTNE